MSSKTILSTVAVVGLALFVMPARARAIVSEWGLVVMTLLVVTTGTLVYARRHPRVPSFNG